MDILGARRTPFMARRNYIVELQHLVLWGVFAGLVEGTVSAVVVSKTFGAGYLLITVVQATPAFANLVSLVWGAMLVGRRKLPLLTAFGAACLAATLAVGFTPASRGGGWVFALQIGLARAFMSGVVSARASIWKHNYPRSHRGRITAGLQIVRTLMSLPVILGCGVLFDLEPLAYRWFYPAVAAFGAAGLLVYQRTHVRGERQAIARRGGDNGDAAAEAGVLAPFSLVSLISPWRLVGSLRQVLREDRRFARYCTAQMCLGSSNLMVMPVNTIVLTKVLELSYTASNGLLDVIPRIVTLAALPLWARLFDRVGVLQFRVMNSACWCGSILLCGLGALLAAWVVHGHESAAMVALSAYAVGRFADGLGQSGGAIAWNIGHLHFAEDDTAELYMGIHVSLTGLRGLIAPFAGALLYAWIDWGVFLVALGLGLMGLIIFARLARDERRLANGDSEAEPLEDRVGARDGVGEPPDLVRR